MTAEVVLTSSSGMMRGRASTSTITVLTFLPLLAMAWPHWKQHSNSKSAALGEGWSSICGLVGVRGVRRARS
jgi:hypothetical protein